jgi:hypothetical protein
MLEELRKTLVVTMDKIEAGFARYEHPWFVRVFFWFMWWVLVTILYVFAFEMAKLFAPHIIVSLPAIKVTYDSFSVMLGVYVIVIGYFVWGPAMLAPMIGFGIWRKSQKETKQAEE